MNPAGLEVRGLRKAFGAVVASDGLTLSVAPGTIHGLIGPNGAGKTTAIAQISGELVPDAGAVLFDGVDVTRMAMPERAGRGLQRSHQITQIFRPMTVADNVLLAAQAEARRTWGLWRPARQNPDVKAACDAALEQVGLASEGQRIAGALSHGMQRQLELAMVLATRPRLVLLDEPMAGLGPTETARMTQLLASLRGTMTMLLVEHDMDVVFQLADRVSVLVKGAVIAEGTPDVIRANSDVRAAYLGDALPGGVPSDVRSDVPSDVPIDVPSQTSGDASGGGSSGAPAPSLGATA